MATPTIDYDALASQTGGSAAQSPAAIDYDALAAQHGGMAQQSQKQQPEPEGFWSSLGHTFGIGKEENQQRLEHPIQSAIESQPAVALGMGAYQGGKRILGELGQALQGAKEGNPYKAAEHAAYAIPFVGSGIQRGVEQLGPNNGLSPAAVGTAVGTAAQIAPMVLGAADSAMPGRATIPTPGADLASKVQQYVRPTPSPSVVPRTEMAARQLSQAILPATKDATNFIQAAQQEVPNVLDYAKRTNNPLNTQLEFSKAAQGYAQEVRQLYDDKVLGPVKGNVVKTTGTGFGDRMQEGPDTYASLGDIDQRIIEINKQLDKPTLNSDDMRRALASKAALQSEASGLRNILHSNLSQASGLAPEAIADLRQRVGRSYELANDTNAAVTQRMQGVGKAELGPIGITQLPSRAIEFARGGPVPIADRAFQRAISQFPGESKPLPTINGPVAGSLTGDFYIPTPAEVQNQRLNQLLSIAREQQNTARAR